jgi:lysophospholipase L1-like esterase
MTDDGLHFSPLAAKLWVRAARERLLRDGLA